MVSKVLLAAMLAGVSTTGAAGVPKLFFDTEGWENIGAVSRASQVSESTGADTFADTKGETLADTFGPFDSAFANAQGYANGDDDSDGGGGDDGGGFAAAYTTTEADAAAGDADARSMSFALSDDDAKALSSSLANSADGSATTESNSLALGGEFENDNDSVSRAGSDARSTGLLNAYSRADSAAFAEEVALSIGNADSTSGFGDAEADARAYSRVATAGPVNRPSPFRREAVADATSEAVSLFGGDSNSNSVAEAFGEAGVATAAAFSRADGGGKASNLADSVAQGK